MSAYTLLLIADSVLPWPSLESLSGRPFRFCHATSAQAEAWLRESDADAAFVRAQRFSEELPPLIKLWKSLRPAMQCYLFLDQMPPGRAVVSLMQAGCQDVFDQSALFDMTAILDSVEERIRFVRVHRLERLQAKQSIHYAGLVGESPDMRRVYDQILGAARSNCPVLLLGETGTGKGLVAHAIHALSQRHGKPFVTVDCGCLAPTLIESELYGVARGAYTGADASRSGLVQAAQHGTLFLDEIAELPLEMQPKLLRLLEEGEVRSLGSHHSTAVDVRVISATGRPLERLIGTDQFRLDLYYRLNVVSIEIPPLRQRPQDVPLLARHFASRHVIHGQPVGIAESALETLAAYSWPGNVRELKNCVEAAIVSASGNVIQLENLPRNLGRAAGGASREPAPLKLRELERQAILRALALTNHDKIRAARILGIGRTTLYRKLKEMRHDDAGAREPSYLM